VGLAIGNLRSFDNYATIYSESPIDDLWNSLLRFSDLHVLRNTFNISGDNSIYASMCLRQAHEYYLTGKTASLQTRPLFIYYCFLNLAKSLICFKKGETEFNYHGLCDTKFPSGYTSPSSILEYSTRVNQGVFQRFAELCGDTITQGRKLTLKSFSANALEINHDISAYFQLSSYIVPVFLQDAYPASLLLDIPFAGQDLINEIATNSKINDDFTLNSSKPDRLTYYKRWDDINRESTQMSEIVRKHLDFSVLDSRVAYLNINPIQDRMSNAVAYWGIAFLLSNIVRYEPIAISKLVSGDDSAYSLLNELCNKLMRVFPNIVFNMITENETRFSSNRI